MLGKVIVVDYNPCYLDSPPTTACPPRAAGYQTLEDAVRRRVQVPPRAAALRFVVVPGEVRIHACAHTYAISSHTVAHCVLERNSLHDQADRLMKSKGTWSSLRLI